uniref:Uncharacterized protein n=1 Tax=Setaria viridis TaxID=4556 RepID=A0A4U6W5P4_SETVI|nr:hypothetical protein SEVIR_1G025300v2 [Setaria viridis]
MSGRRKKPPDGRTAGVTLEITVPGALLGLDGMGKKIFFVDGEEAVTGGPRVIAGFGRCMSLAVVAMAVGKPVIPSCGAR